MTFPVKTCLRLVGLALLLTLGDPFAATAASLRVGMADDPDTLDPAVSGSFISLQITSAMCDRLIEVGPQLDYLPGLASEWHWSADNRALTVTLREGAAFQDGEPFDAAAVKWNIDRYRTAPISQVFFIGSHTAA